MHTFYSAESVTEGHPDKLCDLIADNVLDACLTGDPASRVACEVMATRGHIIVAGEITTEANPDVFNIARDVLHSVGYDPKSFQIDCYLHPQSPDIAGAVEVPADSPEDDEAIGAGDQGVVIGYACSETPELMPMPVVIAHRLTSLLTLARMTDAVHGIGPDGKAMVVVEYEDDKPVRVAQILLSVQHEAGVHIEEIQADIFAQIILPALKGMPADDQMEVILQPQRQLRGGRPGSRHRSDGPQAHGGYLRTVCKPGRAGRCPVTDPTKIDRTAAYMARYIAKNLVAASIAERCRVALTYAIGMAKPMAVTVDTFGTGTYCEDDCLAAAVRHVFDLTPAGMIETLQLQQPMYARTAVGGHFGREDFPWERVDKIGLLLTTID